MKIEHNPANSEKIKHAAEILCGSCSRSVDDVLQEVFDDESLDLVDVDTELLRELDDIAMECQGCNWWCETSDMDEDQMCSDCSEQKP